LPEKERQLRLDELRDRLEEAFIKAYPEVPPNEARHMARNLTQVIIGVVDIGEKVGAAGDITHMDLANTLVYWCIVNTHLEIRDGKRNTAGSSSVSLSDQETQRLLSELVARAADMLIGLEVLSKTPEHYNAFIIGSVALGASNWERDRGKLGY
jgi:hypothetical protein